MPIPSLGQPGFGMDLRNRFRGSAANNPYIQNYPAPTSFSTGSQTLTGAQLIAGVIIGSSNGTGFTYTFPTAAALKTAVGVYLDLQGVQVGDTINCLMLCGGTANVTTGLMLATSTGVSFDTNGNQAPIVPVNTSKYLYLRFTNVTPGSEAYVVYA